MPPLLCVVFAVIIAGFSPARAQSTSPANEWLRQYFEQALAAPESPIPVLGETLREPELAWRFYSQNNYQLAWDSDTTPARQANGIVDAIRESVEHGFQAETYHLATLQDVASNRDPQTLAAYDLLLSDAFLHQAQHRANGVVSPAQLDPDWDIPPPPFDGLQILGDALRSGESKVALDRLWPSSDEYRALVASRIRLASSHEVASEKISEGPLLRQGTSNPRVIALKQRLYGPGTYNADFDAKLAEALAAFQRAAGLEPDGMLGPNTLTTLNARSVDWVARLDANLERWRWLPAAVPKSYIRVNLAAFRLRAIDGGKDVLQMDIIGGRNARRTPVIAEPMRYLVFSPYWNVPTKIAVEDKLPILKRDAPSLDRLGYEGRKSGQSDFRPVSRFDWSTVSRKNFDIQLRQRPGPSNALGGVKFMMPNRHAVYLHDTPNRELFAKIERDFSSGCIRLSQPARLAQWVLQHDGQSIAQPIEDLMARPEPLTINLRKPLPVWLVYFTAFTGDDGQVQFRRDVYDRDGAIVRAIRSGPAS